ncbi:MAG: 5-formyltetrahydrofolate cyclo-ligase, partial [Firmicutes bacterium]|nr:5-formyltetrahydrofolate cyclo-ligase [Bacillota bacterium]
MDIKEQKKALRKQIWAAEKQLSQSYRDEAAAKICANIIRMPEYRAAEVVLAFVSMRREADMTAVLKDALASGKTLCVPLCIGDGIMDFRQI